MRSILLVSILLLVGGCASTSFQELGKQLDSAISGNQKPQASQTQYHSLMINATPSDSVVKIMNIKPKYHDGIRLQSGAYDVLVLKDGYESHREWVNISGRSVTKNVRLQSLAQSNASTSSPTTTQELNMTESVVESTEPVESEEKIQQQEVLENSVAQVKAEPKVELAVKKAKPVVQKTKKAKPVAKNESKKAIPKVASNENFRSDYRPPELSIPSKLVPAKMSEDEQPKFNGVYIKIVEEGFFSDSVKFIELTQKPAYRAILLRAKRGTSWNRSWLYKQPRTYFVLDAKDAITLPIENFSGIVAKGENTHLLSLHLAERFVLGFDKEGKQEGEVATGFESKQVRVNYKDDIYIPLENLENRARLSDDSHLVEFKKQPEKGLYIAWIGDHFWLFNLI